MPMTGWIRKLSAGPYSEGVPTAGQSGRGNGVEETGSGPNGTRITHGISLQRLTSNNMNELVSCFAIDLYAALD
jgi:hypothetical protein